MYFSDEPQDHSEMPNCCGTAKTLDFFFIHYINQFPLHCKNFFKLSKNIKKL